jgi:diacylglycerol kinase (ATP)
MHKNNVILIVNPVSGGINKAALVEQISHYAKYLKLDLYVYETIGSNDLTEIRSLYDQYQPKRVIIAGGDGTIKLVAEALEKQDVIFGIIPVGSANGLATDLGLLKTEEENIAIAFQNHFVTIDSIRINDKICIHMSDIGLNAELIKNYEKAAIRGKLGYALEVFNTLFYASKKFKVKIKFNQQWIETKARMMVVANSQKYGTGIVVNPIGILGDGKFELIVLKRITLAVIIKFIRRKITVSSKDVIVISTDKASVEIDRAVSFQMDGEYCGSVTNLNIDIFPEKLKIAMLKT